MQPEPAAGGNSVTLRILLHENGPALWPERFTEAALVETRESTDEYFFGALYQGDPRPKKGGMFEWDWFDPAEGQSNLVASVPRDADRVRYWDRAASHGKGDYTVGVLMAYAGGCWYVEDVVRGRWAEGDRDNTIARTADHDDDTYGKLMVPVRGEQEPGSAGKDAASAFVRNLAGRDVNVEAVTGNKESRARAFAAQCQFGNVKVKRAAWTGAYLRELIGFPRGKHDDQVDASSGAFNFLAAGGSEWDSAVAGPRRGFR